MSKAFEDSPGFERLKTAMRGVVNLPKADVSKIKSAVRPPTKKQPKKYS